jgi:integrase
LTVYSAYYLVGVFRCLLGWINTAELLPLRVRQSVKTFSFVHLNPAQQMCTRRQFLTLEELEKLAVMPCSNAETKAAFLFSAFSGLRYSDVKALVWSQVKRENGSCFLEFSQTKTGKPETLPLSAEAAAILEGQQNARFSPRITSAVNDAVVFKLGAQQTIDKAIWRWVKRAEIGKKVSFHNARHSFATLSLTHGVDIYTVSKLLGHKRLETTESTPR